ncbi:hypothetical protein HCDG_01857 [Histoplasma capsulatum H143]|uniref:Uncharacterized protein n=1 Tax=Ajellomyces capsulatus (strain H143) TaxID=544712 RepID=C6H606_AJECH|nr:hypothetical protein HCDG_01857 [Histoplasma capsulatum H143]
MTNPQVPELHPSFSSTQIDTNGPNGWRFLEVFPVTHDFS